jgi:hypothetical protein
MKKKEREVLSIQIEYDYAEELEELIKSEDFTQLILDEAISTIEYALDKERKSARVCYIPNLESSVVIEKRNFPKILGTAIKFYEEQEDYTKCAELVKIKNKVDGSGKRNKKGN